VAVHLEAPCVLRELLVSRYQLFAEAVNRFPFIQVFLPGFEDQPGLGRDPAGEMLAEFFLLGAVGHER